MQDLRGTVLKLAEFYEVCSGRYVAIVLAEHLYWFLLGGPDGGGVEHSH